MLSHPHNAATARWQPLQQLFPGLSPDSRKFLELLPGALEKVRPLRGNHKKNLPDDIRELSQLLTRQRCELRRPYWMQPAFVSAYLYYFLPWNLVRLATLFTGLKLPAPGPEALLLDAGSGPLTLPMALWLARPDLRGKNIHVLALDNCHKPLELGQQIFMALAEITGQPAWPVRIACAPLPTLAQKARDCEGKPWLLSCANVLNELPGFAKGRRRSLAEDEADGESGIFDDLLEAWSPLWREDEFAGMLFVEPGTRAGGNAIMELRQCALESGLDVPAPCPHDRACPLMRQAQGNRGFGKAWCHFNFSAKDAPAWLRRLAGEAGLGKESLALSPLMLGRTNTDSRQKTIRIISGPFPVPGLHGLCRYGCMAQGLALLEEAEALPDGALVSAPLPAKPARDAKSGAIIFSPRIAGKRRETERRPPHKKFPQKFKS